MENIVMIQLKDICYYDDDFNYEPIFVIKENDFENKYNKLVKICKNYSDFQEIDDFIKENFKEINVEKKIIEV